MFPSIPIGKISFYEPLVSGVTYKFGCGAHSRPLDAEMQNEVCHVPTAVTD